MVINNPYYIKTEIKKEKPVEIVHELKGDYQIPSFEEFMKTYEVDENLETNYQDEINNYGELGVQSGYGPCYINSQVVVNASCRCSPQEIKVQEDIVRQKSSSRRFQAVFTNSFSLAPYFFTNHPNFLDVGGDTVDWQGKRAWVEVMINLFAPERAACSTFFPNDYRTPYIIIRNIEQLKSLLQAFENGIIYIAGISSPKNTIRELIRKHERGEDISGNYEL